MQGGERGVRLSVTLGHKAWTKGEGDQNCPKLRDYPTPLKTGPNINCHHIMESSWGYTQLVPKKMPDKESKSYMSTKGRNCDSYINC